MIALDEAEKGAFVRLAAKAIDLDLRPEFLFPVLQNFDILATHAHAVMAFTIPDDARPEPEPKS